MCYFYLQLSKSLSTKFPSMSNLLKAAEDSDEVVPSSPPKTPQTLPADKAHHRDIDECASSAATSEASECRLYIYAYLDEKFMIEIKET